MQSTIRRTTGATLFALVTLAAASAAQDQQPARKDPPQEAARPAQDRPAQDQKPERAAGARPDATPQRPGAAGMSREEMIRKMAQEEAKHRERLAKIERLKVLAREKGETERLAALGEMLNTETTRYAAMLEKARKNIDPDTFHAMEQRLAQGRGRGAALMPERPAQKPDQAQKPDAAQKPERKPAAQPPRNEQKQDAKPERKPAAQPPRTEQKQDTKPERKPAADKPKASGAARGGNAPASGSPAPAKPRS